MPKWRIESSLQIFKVCWSCRGFDRRSSRDSYSEEQTRCAYYRPVLCTLTSIKGRITLCATALPAYTDGAMRRAEELDAIGRKWHRARCYSPLGSTSCIKNDLYRKTHIPAITASAMLRLPVWRFPGTQHELVAKYTYRYLYIWCRKLRSLRLYIRVKRIIYCRNKRLLNGACSVLFWQQPRIARYYPFLFFFFCSCLPPVQHRVVLTSMKNGKFWKNLFFCCFALLCFAFVPFDLALALRNYSSSSFRLLSPGLYFVFEKIESFFASPYNHFILVHIIYLHTSVRG